ncbi:hypothetical protein AB0D94_26890 [Streptomyces sp. NPDC048255]|uniref:hypothetical protein n=1 Tax=Streptomyces sp. NPDC048255 TaxID=3154713 RepID=UPI0033F43FCB
MNFKRLAVVAAAAVVGPSVLMATPAMADEAQNPAVSTPDTAPKDDSAPAEAPAAETPAKEAPAAEKPAAEQPAAEAPAAPAPVVPVLPPVDAPAPAPAPVVPPVAETDEDLEWDENLVATGPKLGLNGVPSTFKAGGDWTKFTVSIDNTKGKPQASYVLVLAVANESLELQGDDVRVQVFFNGAWHDVEIIGDGGTPVALLTDDLAIPNNAKLDLQVRVKFNAGAPAGEIAIAVAGGSNEDEDVWSDTVWTESKIVKGGNTTKPNGGSKPVEQAGHVTTPNSGSGSTGTVNTAGQLAETGSDAATSWALGASGVALAMGAALVAGTGRRRRPTA